MEEINAFPAFDQVEVENITENIKFRPHIIKNIEYLRKVEEFPKYERDKANSKEQNGFVSYIFLLKRILFKMTMSKSVFVTEVNAWLLKTKL